MKRATPASRSKNQRQSAEAGAGAGTGGHPPQRGACAPFVAAVARPRALAARHANTRRASRAARAPVWRSGHVTCATHGGALALALAPDPLALLLLLGAPPSPACLRAVCGVLRGSWP